MTLRHISAHLLYCLLFLVAAVQARPLPLTGFGNTLFLSRKGGGSKCRTTSLVELSGSYESSSGGFASATSTKGKKKIIQLSKGAKTLLKKHGNNVDAASSEYFQVQMEETMRTSGVSEMGAIHEARVAATWNTIAMFLPQDYARTKGKVEPQVERRLKYVAAACCPPTLPGGDQSVIDLLDVGCGDGVIIPYLKSNCVFHGMDLSTEMIELGKYQYPKSNFWVGGFPKSVPAGATYDTILFNGSLQFFRDTRQTLEDASNMLKPGGRIVLAHVNGGSFVTDECKKNPMLAVRNMPNNLNRNTMAQMLGLTIADKNMILAESDFNPDVDGNNDDFYLVVLEKHK